MKRIVLLIAIICSVVTAKAQFGVGGAGSSIVGKISGAVIDSVTKKPLDYGTVTLFRATGKSPVTGTLTDEKGGFKLDNIHPGVYRLEISLVGYPTKIINNVETTPGKPDVSLGTMIVAQSTKALSEVTVTGSAPLVENRIDKIVYNAEKDVTAGGGSATDILQKVPLVNVDINGNVSVRGDANVRVLINGRPSGATSASLADVLKGIPADQIKSVEVITSPSAKYDAEGSAGILNIITKQKNISGISGGISGGIGTRQNNGNFNLNYNKNRFNLTMNVGGNAGWPQTSNTYQLTQIDTGAVHLRKESNGTSRVTRHAVTGSVSAGYEFNAYNSLNTTIRLNQIEFNTNSNSVATGFDPFTLHSVAHAIPASGFDWNVDYVHKFKKEGEELDLSTQWSHSIGNTEYTNFYTGTTTHANQKNKIDGTNNEYTLQADYVLPVNKTFKLESGAKYIVRRISTSNDIYSPINGDDFAYNAFASSNYDYDQNVAAAYSVLTINLPKNYSILAGLRDEYTTIDGTPSSAGQQVSPFSQNYNTLVPSLTLQKKLTATQTIKLGYSKRITRPSLQYLNPYVDSTNINAQKVGNPALSPEVSQTVELGYNTFIGSSVINLSAYYKHTSGLIEGIAEAITNGPAAGGTITTFRNIGQNNSFGGSFFGSITPFKILTIQGSINAYTYKPDPSGAFSNQLTQNGTYVQYGGFARGTLTLPSDFIVESFAFGSSARRTIQGTNPAFSIFGMGFKKQFDKKKYSLGVNVIQPFSNYKEFNSNISSPGFKQVSNFQLPFRSFGLTFSYNFGKLNFKAQNPMEKKKGVNNDDLKQDDQGMGGGAPGGGGR